MAKSKDSGRNIINIDQLKHEIDTYVERQQLPEEIHCWLHKTFLRWLINSFTPVVEVMSEQHFLSLTGESPPHWFVHKKEQCQFFYINPHQAEFQESLTRSSEWLASKYPRLAAKFPRMTVPQILKKWQKDHKRMQRRRRNYLDTSGDAIRKCFEFEQFTIVEFIPKHPELFLEMVRESHYMQHCLGEFDEPKKGIGGYGQYYLDRINNEDLRLFSLRDHVNKPHVTLALYFQDDQLWVEQIKGKQNRSPVDRYVPTVQAFLNEFSIHHHVYDADCVGMGLVYEAGRSTHISEISDEKILQILVAREKSLFEKVNHPSPELCWLASLRDPASVTSIEHATDPMKLAAVLQMPLLMTKLELENQIKPKDILKQLRQFSVGDRRVKFLKLQPKRI